jgi:hypothetical protein
MKVWSMRGEQRHAYAGVVNVCSDDSRMSGTHWSFWGGFEPLLDKPKEYVS